MGADQTIDWTRAAESALEWWCDAGVDTLVDDAPRDWFAAPVLATASHITPAAVTAEPAIAAPPSGLIPDTLDAFLAWRTGPDAPEAGWAGAMIAPAGPVDAALMILVDTPEREDRTMLMEGVAGRLFDRMIAAIGLSRESVHLAAICTRRPPGGRLPPETAVRLAELARHHVGLVAPRRLLILGDTTSRAILGTNVRGARDTLRTFNHKGDTVTQAIASHHPRFLLDQPACKAEAWRDLRMIIGGLS